MSLAGLKKQFNKANQYVSEKIGGAKGTELDDDFLEMERKTDVMVTMTEDVISRTHDYLQPNPASKAKMVALNSMAKLRGNAKNTLYPQPEGQLGDAFVKYGKNFGEETILGQCLVEAGEAYLQMAEVKYSLEDNVKQNFLEPLTHLQNKDLKEVMHHRKKLNGRRLDFDCKRRKKEKEKGSHITDEEMTMAEEKFEESKMLAETAMHNLLENDVEQIAQVQAFVESQLSFHQQTVQILKKLQEDLENRRNETTSRPRNEYVPKTTRRAYSPSRTYDDSDSGSYSFNHTSSNSNKPSGAVDLNKPHCEAMFDFEPESEGELGFKEGDKIQLIQQVDENWYEGSIDGRVGHFPINYVTVMVNLQ